jgi:hypothetical protein
MKFNNQAELDKFFRIIQPSDLLGKYRIVDFKNEERTVTSLMGKLLSLLINTGENQAASGLPTMEEIVAAINPMLGEATNPASFHDFVRIYCDKKVNGATYWKGSPEGKDVTFKEVLPKAGKRPRLGVVMTSSPFLTMNVRDTNKIALFMNAIPTLEFSRAVPYLDVRFQFSRPVAKDEKRLRVPSLIKFLDGATEPKGSDKLMMAATIDKADGLKGEKIDVYKAGMELFTAPQTLVNPKAGRGVNRFVKVIDPFRPFMSIDQFEITAAPTVGIFSYKTAKLSITLHDRSRLGEISDLVRPEIYTNTTLSISYGWKHPDKIGSRNAFGDLLNQMSVHNEKYGIVNCSYAFDAVGQCKITMQLAMKGTQDLRVVRIADSKDYVDQTKYFDKITNDIAQLREDAGLKRPESLGKEVRAFQVLDMAERGEIAYSAEDFREIDALISRLKNRKGATAAAAKELSDKLGELFKGPKKGLVADLKKSIESHIDAKFQELTSGEDPFLDYENKEFAKFNKEPSGGQKRANRVCSLTKLFLTFVGGPLSAIDNVDEVQFFFYQFNSQAGQLGDANIGSFPVEIATLKEIFREHATKKGNPNMSVYEFVMLLQGAIIQDPRAIGYGLRQSYTPAAGDKKSEVRAGVKIDEVMAEAVKNTGSFRYPVVEAYIETLAGRPMTAGQISADKIQNDIMRIHIYDKAASPYEPMLQMVKSQTGLQDVIKYEKAGTKWAERQGLRESAIALAQKSGLNIQLDKATSQYVIGSANQQDLKNFITQVIPTVTYGSMNSGLTSATVQTQQNQLLSTTQMMAGAGRQNNTEPNGSAFGGIPLRVIPASLDINSFGCPLLNINQQFFFDFQTGTTIDNIYLLTHITHTIKPGSFTTHGKLVPLDAYGVFESVLAKVQQLQDYLKKT